MPQIDTLPIPQTLHTSINDFRSRVLLGGVIYKYMYLEVGKIVYPVLILTMAVSKLTTESYCQHSVIVMVLVSGICKCKNNYLL